MASDKFVEKLVAEVERIQKSVSPEDYIQRVHEIQVDMLQGNDLKNADAYFLIATITGHAADAQLEDIHATRRNDLCDEAEKQIGLIQERLALAGRERVLNHREVEALGTDVYTMLKDLGGLILEMRG